VAFRTEPAPDVRSLIERLVLHLDMDYIDTSRVFSVRSFGSTSNALARIWELPSIWQNALGIRPHYVIEVVSQHYDKLSEDEKEKTLIHELLHVPRTFSGALRPHRSPSLKIDGRTVNRLHRQYRRTLDSANLDLFDSGWR
jgi:predicted metallopeptidase